MCRWSASPFDPLDVGQKRRFESLLFLPTLFTEGTSANWRTLPVLEEASIDALSFYVSLELLVHIFPRKKRINMLQLESKYMSVENELGPFHAFSFARHEGFEIRDYRIRHKYLKPTIWKY
jgi:hypothetical protein